MSYKWQRTDSNYYTLKTKKFSAEIFLTHRNDTEWHWTVGNQTVSKIGSAKTKAQAKICVEEFGKTIK